MHVSRLDVALAFLLVLGLALAPAAVLAQQGKTAPGEKVNLNTATQEQLQTLPGVGPAIAQRIIEHRNKNGKFNRIEDILNIKGVGEKIFQRIKDRLTV